MSVSSAHCAPAKAGAHHRVVEFGTTVCVFGNHRRWAPTSAGARSSHDERGFTLIEVLIALTIFAMISVAGVMLLRASVSTQAAVAQRLGEQGGINRLRAILAAELASAQPRPWRDDGGTQHPAFTGNANEIIFVHAADAIAGASGLSRARYALANGALVREAPGHVDGGANGSPAALVRNVTTMRWRFRALDGSWADQWQQGEPARLPRAVELTLERRGGAPLTLAFLVGPDGLPPPGQEQPIGPTPPPGTPT
jgi:general secretion pathway protein J